jgi:hypothetical protein
MPATAPRPRSPAQIEATRRNGARSRGPVTPEGKARSSRNALKHGLAALHHFVLEDEAPAELEDLTARLLAECSPESEIEACLVKRMAIAFWKSERAERIEVALFDAAPKLRPPQVGFEWEEADPLTTFDLKRFNAVRGYQAQQGRELSRCLKELRMLRRDALADCTDEPESMSRNEPDDPPEPANAAAAIPRCAGAFDLDDGPQHKPGPTAAMPCDNAGRRTIGDPTVLQAGTIPRTPPWAQGDDGTNPVESGDVRRHSTQWTFSIKRLPRGTRTHDQDPS